MIPFLGIILLCEFFSFIKSITRIENVGLVNNYIWSLNLLFDVVELFFQDWVNGIPIFFIWYFFQEKSTYSNDILLPTLSFLCVLRKQFNAGQIPGPATSVILSLSQKQKARVLG